MDYSKIIAVSGLPGLHELISSKNDGAIVRSLDDKSTKFVSSRIHNFSHLESIEIYTVRDNVNLVDILLAMQKSKASLPDTKDNAAIKKYFETAYPDLDFERVYSSDMKKIIKWFEILHKNKVEIKLSEPPAAEEAPVEEIKEKAPAKEKPAAKAAPKAVKEEAVEEEAPKKKAAPKKKEAEAAAKPVKAAAAKEKPAAKAAPKAAKEKKPAEEKPKKKAAPKKK
ncbi:MAG: DUF5606 domain-containing protein [Chitinophagaceae bacterium]